MDTEVVCPDCHKVIAPPGTVDESLRCRCAESKGPALSADEVSLRPNLSINIPAEFEPALGKDDTDALSPDSSDSGAATEKKEKKCYVCGDDLTGRVRLKDHLNRYWCKKCASADKRAKRRQEELRCPDCSRVFPADKLVYFQNIRVCRSCFKEREKTLEKKIKKVAVEKIHDRAEWQKIKWLAIATGVLLVLGTIGFFLRH